MKLVGSRTSPYVRKARVILAERNLPFEFVEENVWNADTGVTRYNPLTKVPALVMDDGEAIYDSVVICEYLDAISGGTFIPTGAVERALARRDEALGDGIADAGITVFLERKREASRQDPTWIARQLGKVDSGIAALVRSLGPKPYFAGARPGIGDISCACALLWLEFRMPEITWRASNPTLKAWIERMESRPSVSSSTPPR
jgi:glutathione S-transferase